MEPFASLRCSDRTWRTIRSPNRRRSADGRLRGTERDPMTNPTGDPPEQAPTTPIVSWEAPAEAAGPAPGVTFAGFGARLLAYIIDVIIVSIVAFVIALVAVIPIIADRGSGTTTGAAG